MKEIIFVRPNESFNKNCSYMIYLDGYMLVELKNGEKKKVVLDAIPDDSFLQAKIQWCGSKPLSLNQAVKSGVVKVSGNEFLNRKLPLLGALFPMTGILIFRDQIGLWRIVGTVICGVAILGLLWTLTFGRNRWLHMEDAINYE